MVHEVAHGRLGSVEVKVRATLPISMKAMSLATAGMCIVSAEGGQLPLHAPALE